MDDLPGQERLRPREVGLEGQQRGPEHVAQILTMDATLALETIEISMF